MNSELLNLIGNAPKVTLGEYIVRVERANSAGAYGAEDVRGVSNTKGFMETRANIEGRSLKKFLVIEPFEFVFNRRTTRNGERLGLGFNMSDRAFILTEDYVAFRVKPEKDKELSPYFLYLYFLRDEFDRYVRSNSWGSATEFFNWDDMCRVKIPLPPIEVQRAYVDAYKGLTALIEENEALLKTLEHAAQACVAECREKWPIEEVGSFLEETDDRNTDEELDLNAVRGISIEKCFIQTKADMEGVSLRPYKIISPREFAYVTVTSRNGNKISIAMNSSEEEFLVSSSYAAFRVRDGSPLEPEYLYLQFKRPEFDRYARFNSWGSARETFNWEDMCRVKIPLPPIEVQRAYVDAYKGLTALIEENEKLLKSLEATAQACVAECREKWPMVLVGDYVQPFIRKNSDDLDLPFMGVNREKQIVPTSANTENIDRRKYSVLKRGEFVFSGMQTGRDVCIRIALSEMLTDILLSPAYTTFRIDSNKPLLPEYFFLNFKSAEMDRQGWFKSDSSVRSNLDWDRFCEIEIPLPPIEVQRAIVALYHCAEEARKIAAEARQQLLQVCPAMIQRASLCR